MEKVKFDSERGVVDRKSAGTEINPFDLNALEAAVQISEKLQSQVISMTMGPPSAEEALKESIARGANDGILLTDRAFGGADTKATAVTLANAVKKLSSYDLIICGEKSVDGDTGQVGAEVAEFLDIPHVYYVDEVRKIEEDYITVVSNICGGRYIKRVKFPALISVTKDINTPRLPSLRNKMMARKAEIKKWSIDDLKEYLNPEEVGLKGSPTRVKRIEVPPEIKRQGKVCRNNISSFVDEIFKALKENKILEG
jgi:electron transfer flavoprotein beta subunit